MIYARDYLDLMSVLWFNGGFISTWTYSVQGTILDKGFPSEMGNPFSREGK